MSQVHRLYRLQQIDSEISAKKERLIDVLRAQKADEALRAAKQKAEEAGREFQRWQRQQKALEQELGSVNEKARRSEQRLYSGNVKNPKELEDLQHEVEALGRRRGALEDEILDTMVLAEEAQAADEQATARANELESGWTLRLQSLRKEQTEIATRVNDLLAERKEYAARIPPDLMAAYQKTAGEVGGIAVSALEQGRCQVCKVTVSGLLKKAVDQGELVYCGSCDRILVLP
jgi:predicted  nucleic acid-binding Zn-ribbon protein